MIKISKILMTVSLLIGGASAWAEPGNVFMPKVEWKNERFEGQALPTIPSAVLWNNKSSRKGEIFAGLLLGPFFVDRLDNESTVIERPRFTRGFDSQMQIPWVNTASLEILGISRDGASLQTRLKIEGPGLRELLSSSKSELEANMSVRLDGCDGDAKVKIQEGDPVEKVVEVMSGVDLSYGGYFKCSGHVQDVAVGDSLSFGSRGTLAEFSNLAPTANPLMMVHELPGSSVTLSLVKGKSMVLESDIAMQSTSATGKSIDLYAHHAIYFKRVDAAQPDVDAVEALDNAAIDLTDILERYKSVVLLVRDMDAAQREPYLAKFIGQNRQAIRLAGQKLQANINQAPLLQKIAVVRSISRAYQRIRILEAKTLRADILDTQLRSAE